MRLPEILDFGNNWDMIFKEFPCTDKEDRGYYCRRFAIDLDCVSGPKKNHKMSMLITFNVANTNWPNLMYELQLFYELTKDVNGFANGYDSFLEFIDSLDNNEVLGISINQTVVRI